MIKQLVLLFFGLISASLFSQQQTNVTMKPLGVLPAPEEQAKSAQEQAREAKLSAAFASLEATLQAKEYEKAISMVDESLKEFPGEFRLIAIKSFVLYKYLDKLNEAFSTIDAAIAANPKLFDLYDFKLEIIKNAQMENAKERTFEVYQLMAKNLADQPMQLSEIGYNLLRKNLGEVRLAPALLLLSSAKANMGNLTNGEKYLICTNLARGYYFSSRADLAAKEQAEALTYADNMQKITGQQLLDFYHEAEAMAKELGN